jgi:hypothetical protein
LYAAQSWHWVPSPVENMWRGVEKRMNTMSTSFHQSGERTLSSVSTST